MPYETRTLAKGKANRDGTTPLRSAARRDDAEVLAALVGAGADLNAGDGDARTDLHYAVASGKASALAALLAAGADPNIRDRDGTTPLRSAARN